jgi:hypothetical protein
MDLRDEGILKLPQGFLFATFGSSGNPEGLRTDSLLFVQCDLLAAGRMAFSLAQKAIRGAALESLTMDWALSK